MRDRRALEGLLEPWTAGLRSRSPHTARSYHDCVARFLRHAEDGITPDGVAAYLASLEGLSAASQAHHISAVRSFLRYAKARGVIARDPAALLVRPRVAITSMNRYLSEDELRAVIQAAAGLSRRHHAACLFLATTGVRVAEAAQAEWRHLFRDPEGRLGLLVVGKGGKERAIKVPEAAFRAVVALHGGETLDARDRSPLLPDARGTEYSPNGLWRLVHASVAASGLGKPASPRWLRHSFATLAAHGGAPAYTLQSTLGHSRLETSHRYVHWARRLADQAADFLPDLAIGGSDAQGRHPSGEAEALPALAPGAAWAPGPETPDREDWRVW